MTKNEKIKAIIDENNGYLFTSQVVEADISKTYMARYVRENGLEKVAHGIYVEPDIWPDELYILQLKNPKIVYAGETALYLHEMIDREYSDIFVNVPAGHNRTRLNEKGIKVHQEPNEIYELGVFEVETSYGHKVRTYNKERCICDLIINRRLFEVQHFQTAMKGYMRSKDKNLTRLMYYADKLNIRDEVMKYVEVLA